MAGYKELEYEDVEQLIINCQMKLNKRLKLTPNLCAALRKLEVLDEDTADELSADKLTVVQQKEKLMKTIEQKGVEAFLHFCHALTDKGVRQDYIVKEVFKLQIEDIERQRATFAPEVATDSAAPAPAPAPAAPAAPAASAAPAAPAVPATANAAPSAPAEQADDEPFIKSQITNVTKAFADKKMKDEKQNYRMKSNPRGRCIILSNDNFASKGKDRTGSDKDSVNLNMLFTDLGFTVVTWSNLPAKDIKARILEEHIRKDHSECDAFIMCVLSHGNKGNIQDVNSKDMNILEELVDPFNSANAPRLANKPKMFFIQACQGVMTTTGVKRSTVQPDSSDDFDDIMKEFGAGQPEATGPTSHEMADILLVNSTFEGYLSFRDTNVGSFFMRDLVTVFRSRCHEEHVADMVTEITRRLDERDIGSNDYKQVCGIKIGTLKRKVFFLPGYSEE